MDNYIPNKAPDGEDKYGLEKVASKESVIYN